MGVDHLGDRRGERDGCHRVEHPLGEPEIEQRVDQQRSAVADDEAGIAPPPAAVGLEVGVAAIGHLLQTWRVVVWHGPCPTTVYSAFVRQLSGVDASFLNMETASVFGHVSSLNIYDPTDAPGGAGLEATKQTILERIDLLAPFRRRLVEVPLGLDLPYWIEDPDFDIDFHVRHHAVPPPGTPQQLAEAISRIVARPLDRARPLWELYVIEGVDNGRLIAQLTKVHHAAIDGASGAVMLAAVLDLDPEYRPVIGPAPWEPEAVPSDEQLLRMTLGELLRRPEKMIRLGVRTTRELAMASRSGGLRALADLIAQPVPGAIGGMMRRRLRAQYGEETDRPPALPPTHAPRTPWNQAITPHRRFAYTTIPLDDAKQVRRAVRLHVQRRRHGRLLWRTCARTCSTTIACPRRA